MKKIYLWAFMALIGMSACSDDSGLDIGPNEVPSGGNEVDVHISLRKPGAVDYVPYSQIWIDQEASVDSLIVFVFEQKADSTGLLEKIVPQDTSGLTDAGAKMQLSLKITGSHDRVLYFIANGTGINDLRKAEVDYTTEATFMKYVTNASLSKTPLLMTASAKITRAEIVNAQTNTNGVLPLTDVTLKRVSARLDIENYEKALVIDSVRLEQTPSRSYIIANLDELNAPVYYSVNDTVWPTVRMSTLTAKNKPAGWYLSAPGWTFNSNAMSGGNPTPEEEAKNEAHKDSVHIPSLFFPYESPASATDAPMLRIWGRLEANSSNPSTSGSEVQYAIPLVTGSEKILRNNRYVFRIINALTSSIKFKLSVEDWQIADNDTVYEEIDAGKVKVTLDGARLEDKTLKVPATFAALDTSYVFAVEASTEWTLDWDAGVDPPSWVELDGIYMNEGCSTHAIDGESVGKYFKIIVKRNETNAQRGDVDGEEVWVLIQSKADSEKSYSFNVVQAGV